jgi:hypothetical protein
VRVEHRAARHLHLVVAEQRAPDLVGVVGAERALVAGDDPLGPARRRRGSAPRARAPSWRGAAATDPRGRRAASRRRSSRDERDVPRRAGGERVERAGPARRRRRPSGGTASCRRFRATRDLALDCLALISSSTGRSRSTPAASVQSRGLDHQASTHERGARFVERRERRAALHDRAREQSARRGRRERVQHQATARRLAERDHSRRDRRRTRRCCRAPTRARRSRRALRSSRRRRRGARRGSRARRAGS